VSQSSDHTTHYAHITHRTPHETSCTCTTVRQKVAPTHNRHTHAHTCEIVAFLHLQCKSHSSFQRNYQMVVGDCLYADVTCHSMCTEPLRESLSEFRILVPPAGIQVDHLPCQHPMLSLQKHQTHSGVPPSAPPACAQPRSMMKAMRIAVTVVAVAVATSSHEETDASPPPPPNSPSSGCPWEKHPEL